MNGFRKKPVVWGPIPPVPKPDQFPAVEDQDTKEKEPAGTGGAPVMEAAATGTARGPQAAATEPEDTEERVFPVAEPYSPPGPPAGQPYPGMELARAYIPYQMYGATYSPREALERGTLFPDLYRPYPY